MIICAILRQLHLISALLLSFTMRLLPFGQALDKPFASSHDWSFFRSMEPFDVFFVDQLSAGIPLLRWLGNTRVVFYCHFPDLLLGPNRDVRSPPGIIRALYRMPVDALEEVTSGQSWRSCSFSFLPW